MELIVRNKNNEHGELLDYFGVPQPLSNKVEQTHNVCGDILLSAKHIGRKLNPHGLRLNVY